MKYACKTLYLRISVGIVSAYELLSGAALIKWTVSDDNGSKAAVSAAEQFYLKDFLRVEMR